jgi:hypothetical protein
MQNQTTLDAPAAAVPKWTRKHTIAVGAIPIAILGLAMLSSRIGFFAAWVLNMALLVAFAVVVGQGIVGLKRGALIDERNRISLSRLQLSLWTVLLLSSLITATMLNVYRGEKEPLSIALPQELWWLMGISTTSLVGSGLIKSTKKDGTPDEGEKQTTLAEIAEKERVPLPDTKGKLVVKSSPLDANWYDLFMGEEAGNGSHLDLGKVQMFYFTWILVVAYAATIADAFHGLPSIHAFPILDKGMIALLGISHAGYLTNKALPHTKDA